jgi:hypothetical protein
MAVAEETRLAVAHRTDEEAESECCNEQPADHPEPREDTLARQCARRGESRRLNGSSGRSDESKDRILHYNAKELYDL